jgi:Ni,Fe-hydrogenase III large subunit
MKLDISPMSLDNRAAAVKTAVDGGSRIALISSIDGHQLITLLVNPETKDISCYETALETDHYSSLTPHLTQAHWFERATWDQFGLIPQGHPRLKHTRDIHVVPIAEMHQVLLDKSGYEFLSVEGDGIYEIPVGPIHAGIIEPGHFRFSCYGEVIVNLEIRLGYVHRGIERRLTEVPWNKARFVAEAAASDSAVANASALSMAIESLLNIEVPRQAALLRMAALEVERLAMHLSDLGGLAGDIGFLAVSSSMARIRGLALRMAELLSGNRFMRAYICPGGVTRAINATAIKEMQTLIGKVANEFGAIIERYLDNQVAADRMEGVGKVSHRLAGDFGLVGIAARASGIEYDCRSCWSADGFPPDFRAAVEQTGDVFARAKLRISEIKSSLNLLTHILGEVKGAEDAVCVELPKNLPANEAAVGIVESHRGELIHFIATDEQGKIKRYCIKDPSVNNWTALAIAARNNLVADFPLCNKSFSLSYSGHDL